MASLMILQGSHGTNKVHILRPRSPPVSASVGVAVFFLGDRIESSGVHPDIARLQDPVQVANVLAGKYPSCTVAVVSPSRMEAGCSCYDHFLVKLTVQGEPLGYHGASFKASEQLQSLLQAAELCPSPPTAWRQRISVIGFSKGGVVLNQLMAEIAALEDVKGSASVGGSAAVKVPASAPLLRSLRQLHYLDAGLNCRGAYMTDSRVIEPLGRWCKRHPGALQVVLHGTPRQWDDPRRPFLAAEKNRMAALCAEAGVPLKTVKYFEGQKPTLKLHFDVIECMEVQQ